MWIPSETPDLWSSGVHLMPVQKVSSSIFEKGRSGQSLFRLTVLRSGKSRQLRLDLFLRLQKRPEHPLKKVIDDY